MQGTLAYDLNAENLDILENLIKDKAGVSDEDVSTPYPNFNEPFVARYSVEKNKKFTYQLMQILKRTLTRKTI